MSNIGCFLFSDSGVAQIHHRLLSSHTAYITAVMAPKKVKMKNPDIPFINNILTKAYILATPGEARAALQLPLELLRAAKNVNTKRFLSKSV